MSNLLIIGLTVHLAGCLASQEALLSLYGAPSDVGLSEELAALAEAIPGQPGEDYPVYSVPPDTSFSCDGKIEGYYGDPEADCQSFHICANDGIGGLLKYTFLCPNGTIFNQQYFICDWWFNVDCSLTEEYYYLNEEVAAAAAAATAAENLLNGQQINFPSRPGAQQGSGVIPGQTFSGIQPRLGKNKDLSGDEGRASFGNSIEDDLSLAGDNFPQDRIPVQFLGGNDFGTNPNIQLKLRSSSGNAGRRGFFRKKKKHFYY